MHNAKTSKETLEFLRDNYLDLAKLVDIEHMPIEQSDQISRQPYRPFRIRTWLLRQGHFLSVWALWEYYATKLCEQLLHKPPKHKGDSFITWVRNRLEINGRNFPEFEWFESANCLRNLVVHYGSRVIPGDSRANELLTRAQTKFNNLDLWKDGYVELNDDHLCQLRWNVELFIDNTQSDDDIGATPPRDMTY